VSSTFHPYILQHVTGTETESRTSLNSTDQLGVGDHLIFLYIKSTVLLHFRMSYPNATPQAVIFRPFTIG
jgi:hypothetical protein